MKTAIAFYVNIVNATKSFKPITEPLKIIKIEVGKSHPFLDGGSSHKSMRRKLKNSPGFYVTFRN